MAAISPAPNVMEKAQDSSLGGVGQPYHGQFYHGVGQPYLVDCDKFTSLTVVSEPTFLCHPTLTLYIHNID